MIAFLRSIYQTYFVDLIEATDKECAEHKAKEPAGATARRLLIVIFGGAFCMMFVRLAGNMEDEAWLGKLIDPLGLQKVSKAFVYWVTKAPGYRLNQRIWWSVARIVGYVVMPALIAKFALKMPLRECGFKIKGVGQWRTYLLLAAIVAPFIFIASYGDAFQHKYPYYRFVKGEGVGAPFLIWELLYASQFLGIEFFFRGFLIHGVRKQVGWAAILVPIIPYLTIHFGKPLPEMVGSLITGFVLGTLSLRSRSVFGGWAVHAFVACSMDWLSIWHRGLL